MPIFMYGLKCPIAGVIRYIGKSINPEKRRREHINSANRYEHHTARWIRILIAAGLEPELIIIHQVKDGERWQDAERKLIASANELGWKLTNSTAGGEGLDYLNQADKDKYLTNLSASLKAFYATPEGKAKMDAVRAKGWSDPEIVAKRVAAVRAAHQTASTRERVTKANREIASRPEVKAAQSASHKIRRARPEIQAKYKAAFSSDDTRAKMSASAKKRFARPDAKAYLSTPERRQNVSNGARRRATPEYRTMMAEITRLSWIKRKQNL